jgi:hypothetical protein
MLEIELVILTPSDKRWQKTNFHVIHAELTFIKRMWNLNIYKSIGLLLLLLMSMRWDGHQQDYCSFLRWYMSTESHGGMILTGETEEHGDKPVPVPICPPQIEVWAEYYLLFYVKVELCLSMQQRKVLMTYDLKLSRRQDSIKSSRAINRVRWIKETDVSRTISVFIIRDVMWFIWRGWLAEKILLE